LAGLLGSRMQFQAAGAFGPVSARSYHPAKEYTDSVAVFDAAYLPFNGSVGVLVDLVEFRVHFGESSADLRSEACPTSDSIRQVIHRQTCCDGLDEMNEPIS
jgi:hypothetical protein